MSQKNTICWIDLPVRDLKRAAGFYTEVLGAEVSVMSEGGYEFALVPHFDNNVSGCLYVDPNYPPSQQGALIYFSVEGRLDQAVEAVKTHGGTVHQEKHAIGPHGYRAVIVDCEGNRVALHSHVG